MSQFNRAGRAMPPLPVPTRWLILAICLLQGFLLYYFFSDHAAIRYAGFSHNIYGQTMALTLPVLISLSVVQPGDRRFWGGTGLLILLLAGMAAWAKSNIAATSGDSVMVPFNLSLTLLVFLFCRGYRCRRSRQKAVTVTPTFPPATARIRCAPC